MSDSMREDALSQAAGHAARWLDSLTTRPVPPQASVAEVTGGTHPAALGADWLVSAWDQNAGLRLVTPAHSAVEDITSAWLLDCSAFRPAARSGSSPARRCRTSRAWPRRGTRCWPGPAGTSPTPG